MLKVVSHKSKLLLIFCLLFLCLLYSVFEVSAQGCASTDYDCQIRELQQEYDARKDAHEKNKSELESFKKQIASIQKKLVDLDKKLKDTEKEIRAREADLAEQEELMSARLREMYKRNREFNFLTFLLSSKSVADFSQDLGLRRMAAKQDWQIITLTSDRILKLKSDKDTLKKNQASLSSLKSQVDKQVTFLAGEVEKMEGFFAQIKAKQKELIALKEAGFATSVGDIPLADDPASRPDYNPGFSPAFAAFSFGAPHRVGMSQYGAYGRSKSGQSAEDILAAYYQGAQLRKDYPVPSTIGVSGYGRIAFEDNYLLGIYEVPEKWGSEGGFEALKAQAVAARSYALSVTNNGSGTICPTESCQVYKPQLKSGKWAEAVRATKGWVIVKDGKPASTYYSSTTGGYTISQWGWKGIKDASGGWPDTAYEKVAGSPWFYKAWYRTRSGSSYGRQHPWLNEAEFSDIINALLIYKGNESAKVHLSPVDWDVPETWSMDKVKEEASKYGGPVSKVSSVDVFYSNNGYTAKVYVETDKGRKEFTGEEFKYVFNLRAPGAIGIKSSLFNIMKK
jgi:peptidoglycan hydrolase CwlO-like protein